MPDARVIHWVVFHVLLLVLLATEWLLLRKQTPARSYIATAMWLLGALGFTAYVYLTLDQRLGTQFIASYALEESLSIDNLFVFLLLFQSFKVERNRQRKVLFWGILGAVIMRAAFIVAGVALLKRFEWITYIFAVLLLIAAVRLVLPQDHDNPKKPAWQTWLETKMSFSDSQAGFFVQEDGHRKPTILLLALCAIAVTDFVFALDSIPAVLSITRHTFIAYSSNILAVMGLRSLYFVLSHASPSSPTSTTASPPCSPLPASRCSSPPGSSSRPSPRSPSSSACSCSRSSSHSSSRTTATATSTLHEFRLAHRPHRRALALPRQKHARRTGRRTRAAP